MEIGKTSLTIKGEPEEEVRVVYRSNADPQPPPVWKGKLGRDGSVTITVPQAWLVIIGSNGGQAVLELHETKSTAETVQL